MKIRSFFSKFRRTKPAEPDLNPNTRNIQPGAVNLARKLKWLTSVRRSKHRDHSRKSMRRGIQILLERRQRPFRLAWIANSVNQANAIAAEKRAARRRLALAA